MAEVNPVERGKKDKKAIYKVRNVVKSFYTSEFPVLNDVSFDILEGDFMIVFGPSGCGKSTLLHTLIGLEFPDKGNVFYHSEDLYSLSEDQRASFRKNELGMIYQQPNWIKSLNVVENVEFTLKLAGLKAKDSRIKALKSLKTVSMENFAYAKPTELSIGQQQKVSLARALVLDPQVIIADEPTGNLDFRSSTSLMQLLKQLSNDGKTVILVTHELGNLKYANFVLPLQDGNLQKKIDVKDEGLDLIRELGFINKEKIIEPSRYQKIDEVTDDVVVAHPLKRFNFNIRNIRSYTQIAYKEFTRIMVLIVQIFLSFFLIGFNKFMQLVGKRKDGDVSSYFKSEEMSYIELLKMSIKNVLYKKSRALFTVGGIAIGMAVIVFLVSLGYGVENLVLSEISTLEERKQVDISPAISSDATLNDEKIEELVAIQNVNGVYPANLVSGAVEFNNSVTDVTVFGVQSDYLKQSTLDIRKGDVFESNELDLDKEKQQIVSNRFADIGEDDKDTVITGNIDTNQADIDQIISELLNTKESQDVVDTITFPEEERVAIINNTLVESLGLDVDNVYEESIALRYNLTLTKDTGTYNIITEPVEYKVTGVINDEDSKLVYVPIVDTKYLGITGYTQAKVTLDSETNVVQAREVLASMGFRTQSVTDQVIQVESLFANIRVALGVIGFVALLIAAMGMFNTLTVSLLERSREIGLMKALGMKTNQVKDLFYTESIVMSLSGGLLGIMVAFLVGIIVSIVFAGFTVSRGLSGVSISYIPVNFALFCLFLAFVVGVITGLYPAQRSSKIRPIDALRYE